MIKKMSGLLALCFSLVGVYLSPFPIMSVKANNVSTIPTEVFAQSTANDLTLELSIQTESIVAGYNSTFLILGNQIMVWGSNAFGELGLGDRTERLSPTHLSGLTGIKQLASGYSHTLALMKDGTVKSWGNNDYGQLGLGDRTIRTSPTNMLGLNGVKQLSTGNGHTLALLENGTVVTWGKNDKGQLGLGDTTERLVPTGILELQGVKEIAAGDSHSLALMEDGTVKVWGLFGGSKPSVVQGLTGVKQLAAAGNHTLALLTDGTLKTWGHNESGQLGLGDKLNRTTPTTVPGLYSIKYIGAGINHSVAISNYGDMFTWGGNNFGQLGLGDRTERLAPAYQQFRGVKQLGVGLSHVVALLDDGTLKVWGDNQFGQLGLGDKMIRVAPTLELFGGKALDAIYPSVFIKGAVGSSLSIRYYIDDESEPREQRTAYLSNGTVMVDFHPIAKSTLYEVQHTYRVVVNNHSQNLEKSMTFKAGEKSMLTTLTVNSTTSSIEVRAEDIDPTSLYPFDYKTYSLSLGYTSSSSFVSTPFNQYSLINQSFSGLTPNTKYFVKFHIKNNSGNNQPIFQEAYTLAVAPTLNVLQISGQAPILVVNDNNPAITQYQITSGNQYLNAEGKLVNQPVNLTLPNKKFSLSKIKTNRSQYFKVRAINQEGVATAWSSTALLGTTVTPPAVPKNIKSQPGNEYITITWSPVSEATAYEIEIDNGETPINVGRTLNYKHLSLLPNTLHQYRIRAVKDGAPGAWSAPIVQRTLMLAPLYPTNIVLAATAKTVNLTWEAVPGALSYEVEWDGQVFATGKQATFRQTNLPIASRHTYRVRALNTGGTSPWSITQIISTTSELPSTPVANIPVVADRSVHLSWEPVLDALSYEVEADGAVVSLSELTTAGFTGLAPGSAHQYRIRAVNELGAGSWSSPINIETYVLATPSVLTEQLSDTSISLGWGPVKDAIFYEVETDGHISVTSSVYAKSIHTPETTHTFRIRAIGTSGNSAWTEPIVLSTLPEKPAVPLNVTATASKNQVYLHWSEVAGALGYDVELDGVVVVDNFTETTYVDTLLDPFSQHQYRIRARTDAMEGDWSEFVVLRTLPDRPGIPNSIAVTSTANIVTLSWTAEPSATKYEVEVDGQVFDNGKKTMYKHRRVAQGTEHKYRIRTTNVSGVGAWSGMIINNTLVARLTKSVTVDMGMVGKDIMDFSRYTLKVTYDPNAIEIVDLSTLTGTRELTTGRIGNTDVIVTSFRPGEIIYVSDKAISPDESWTGVINSLQMRAKVSGGSSITYSVIEIPEEAAVQP
ncbi:hypothetical protein J4772_13855 [Cohnella sp. LGH]|uniref:RCC1 domain-containing protein n=1 Tax=Cohnella sp. LGH TaxID=1619153 RepID=UPI001ADB0789|nr:hypothetical protein [Cohnella sp. LGH]QTH45394.1 hypothetical protein J4772_13855 [Cohnella sp. LGH]